MIRRTAAGLLCLLALAATPTVAVQARPEFRILVHVQNYARLDRRLLARAEADTARVFAPMAVEIAWLHETAAEESEVALPQFSIVLMSPAMAADKSRREHVASTTIATGSRSTGRAYVFCERVFAAAERHALSEGGVFGRVLAHELGHMIGGVGHDAPGIMGERLELNEAGFFRFTRAQEETIRAALREAMAANAPMLALRQAPVPLH
jgi:hypothetical protein